MKEHFREAAAKDEAVYLGDFLVAKRAEIDELSAQALQGFEAGGIVEGESFVSGHADADFFLGRFAARLFGFQERRMSGDFQERLGVHPFPGGFAHVTDDFLSLDFRHRREAQVALRCLQAVVPVEGTDDRHVDFFHHFPHHGFVAVGAQAIQDDPGDMDVRVVFAEAQGGSGDAVAHGLAVQHQDHRRMKLLRDVGSGADAIGPAVVEAHDPFDDGNIRALGERREGRRQALRRRHPGVQVVRIPSGSLAMEARVDVVRPHFEWLHGEALGVEIRKEAGDNRRFPYPAICPGYDNTRTSDMFHNYLSFFAIMVER